MDMYNYAQSTEDRKQIANNIGNVDRMYIAHYQTALITYSGNLSFDSGAIEHPGEEIHSLFLTLWVSV